jgi:hypothetical protein
VSLPETNIFLVAFQEIFVVNELVVVVVSTPCWSVTLRVVLPFVVIVSGFHGFSLRVPEKRMLLVSES